MTQTPALLNGILEHGGQKPPGKIQTHSQDKTNTKKVYVVDSKCTDCKLGIIVLFDNKYELFSSTGPHPCKYGLTIFDAKILSGKDTKTHTRIEIEPALQRNFLLPLPISLPAA